MTTKTVKMVVEEAEKFEIVTEPSDWTVTEIGETATFTVEATGVASYQWQYQWKVDNNWYNSGSQGNTTASMSIQSTEARIGQMYRCVLTGNDGSILISKEVTMVTPSNEFTIDDITYAIIEGTSNVLVKSYNGSSNEVVVPEIVNGYVVVEIGESAFADNSILESIDLPDTIEIIRRRAFANCTSLKNMR